MLIGLSAVRKVPEGAEVVFSLPCGAGSTPPIRWFDMTHPIVETTASDIATSR
jgi:hypothetical protein